MVRYPHKGVITWSEPSTKGAKGVMIEGKKHDLAIECRLEPTNQSMTLDEGGKVFKLSYKVFCASLSEDVPDSGSKLTIRGTTRNILRIHPYGLHTEIWL